MEASRHPVDGEVGRVGIKTGDEGLVGESRSGANAGESTPAKGVVETSEVSLAERTNIFPGTHDDTLRACSGKMDSVSTVLTPPQTVAQTDTTVRATVPWKVVVWNDPVTPMVVVTLVFKKVFGYPETKATQLMLQVHHEGRAVVWSGARERAEKYCLALQTHGLLASLEQDDA